MNQGENVKSERGNFLLQALLSLTLVFAFIPFFARRMATRDMGAQMYTTTRQVETVRTAAKSFIIENANTIPFGRTRITGDKFIDELSPYGLPIGFLTRTAMGQDISLIINNDDGIISAFVRLSGGNLGVIQRAELARRIGFFAMYNPEDPDGHIDIGIQLADMYSDVVRRNEKDYEYSGFLSDLNMGGFRFDNAATILAENASFDTAEVTTLGINGTESGRKERSGILNITTNKTVFQTSAGESALSISRGELNADSMVVRTVSKYGSTGNITVGDAAVDSFDMSTGHTGFEGPTKWNVGGNIITSRITFNVERLDVSSLINITRGQDVYIDSNTLTYNTASGIDTGTIYASNITLRDQTSGSLTRGGDGAAILDIRPAGASVLPDALVDDINNGGFNILARPTDDDNSTVKCESIIGTVGGKYNAKSLSQYIICQYVFWQRLEHRINIKQCLMEGNSDCR